MFLMFGFLNSLPGARECHNRNQLNKICLNVVSNLKFAFSKAHSWPRVGPVTQAHIVRLNTYSDSLGRSSCVVLVLCKVFLNFQNKPANPQNKYSCIEILAFCLGLKVCVSIFQNWECQTRIPNREFVLSASGVHSPGPHQSCRLGHNQSPVHRRGG
jgi:hypothetical protein